MRSDALFQQRHEFRIEEVVIVRDPEADDDGPEESLDDERPHAALRDGRHSFHVAA